VLRYVKNLFNPQDRDWKASFDYSRRPETSKRNEGLQKKISKSKAAASSFLQATGMYDKNGKLKKEYK
jgi:hypothetical protein